MLACGDLYAVLHLQQSASGAEIRSAYRHAALHAHPDKGGCLAAFHSIALAYEVLSCPASRDIYDKQLKHHQHTSRVDASRNNPRTPIVCKKRKQGVPASTVPPTKRHCAEHARERNRPTTQESHTIRLAMEQLQTALQDLPKGSHRKAAICRMPPHVQKELLKHAVNRNGSMPNSKGSKVKRSPARVRGQDSFTRGTDIRAIKHLHKTTYQVQLRIRHLRMYTKTMDSFDTAIQHQMILVEARQALRASGDSIWGDPHKFCDVFIGTLQRFGTCIEELALSVFISMKADDYICRPAAITSPVLSLAQAVVVHARLSRAAETSWEDLRSEWIPLMQQTQRSRRQNLSLVRIEEIVDAAHLKLLQRRFCQAVSACGRAIRLHVRIEKKTARVQARTKHQTKKQKIRSVAALRQQRRREWVARRHWHKRPDLTMADIIQGPPRQG